MSVELGHKNPAEQSNLPDQRRQQIWPVTHSSNPASHGADLSELDQQLTGELQDDTHFDVLKNNTGWTQPPALWAKQALRRERRSAETQRIAAILVRAGVDVYRGDHITYISTVTDIVESKRSYRSICMLPEIAARERRDMVNGLQFFMSKHEKCEYLRYAVMTADSPVPVGGDLRSTIQQLSRRISKWSDHLKKWDIKVLYRGIEFTRMTAEKRNMGHRHDPDTVLYHVHANVIYWPTRALKPSEWSAFLRFTKSHVGGEWSDNGRIKDAEQVIKYCNKPADTVAAADDEIVWLYHQTAKLKMCQPLGDFKVWRQTLKKRGEKIAHIHVGGGESRPARVKKARRNPNFTEQSVRRGRDGSSSPVVPHQNGQAKAATNVFLGMTQPLSRHSPWREPLMMFLNYDPTTVDDGLLCAIEGWRKEIRGWWNAADAPAPDDALEIAKTALANARSDEGDGSGQPNSVYILDLSRATVRDEQSDLGLNPYVQPGERFFADKKIPRSPSATEIIDRPSAIDRLKIISKEADQQRNMAERRLRGLTKQNEAEGRQTFERDFPAGKSVIAALMTSANHAPEDENLVWMLSAINELAALQAAA